jgi:hypothetical protein
MITRFPLQQLLFALVACAACLAWACGDGRTAATPTAQPTSGPPRPYVMGFSTLPRELNADSYEDAIDFAADNGEIMLVQRMIPWSDFLPGTDISDRTAKNTASERDKIAGTGKQLFFAIDLTDGATGRDRLADLPVSVAGKRFDDPGIRAAVVAYAEYVAINYQPDYMSIGVEMNLYYEKNKDDFANFRTLFQQAYRAVKAKSPSTQVTVTFQYEDLQGLMPRDDPHFASWQLVNEFVPLVDVFAIATYPSFYYRSADDIMPTYYSQLRAFTQDKPIVIAEMGYASAAGAQGLNSGTQEDQVKFLRKVLLDAEALNMPVVIWFAIWDPAYAGGTAFAPFQSIGLITDGGDEKPAWDLWQSALRRPVGTP